MINTNGAGAVHEDVLNYAVEYAKRELAAHEAELADGQYYGHVKLSDATDSTSGNAMHIAATPLAVYRVRELADAAQSDIDEHKEVVGNATTSGHLMLSDATGSESGVDGGVAATPKAVHTIREAVKDEVEAREAADNALVTIIDGKINREVGTSLTTAPTSLTYDGEYGATRYEVGDIGVVTTDDGNEYYMLSEITETGSKTKPYTLTWDRIATDDMVAAEIETAVAAETAQREARESDFVTLLNGKAGREVGTSLTTTVSTLYDSLGAELYGIGNIGVKTTDDGNEYYILSEITTVSGPKTSHKLTWERIATEDMLAAAIEAEAQAREDAIDAEAAARADDYDVLQHNIWEENQQRLEVENELSKEISDETVIRENTDDALSARIDTLEGANLDARVTAVETKAHTHANKAILDSITSGDIDLWNTIKDQVTEAELKEAIDTAIDNLVNGAPEAMDTLKELADAIEANEDIMTALEAAIGNKVDKVTGKGLSTNDYTTAEKTKLAGIEAGAQVNTVTGVKGNAETTYRIGNINITKADIGLGNVDNTSDADKPVSTATQKAIDAEAEAREIADAAEAKAREEADTTLQSNIDAHTAYETDIIQGLLSEIQTLYGLLGITIYDGGLFTQDYDGEALDGGDFTDEDLPVYDCGSFEPITIGSLEGVDGGTY